MKENNKTLVLIGLMIGMIFAQLDETVVTTAMPSIIRDLHGLPLYGWVAGVYMLALTSFMPIMGKLADLFGHKKIYMVCMGLFMLGSIVSGLAPSMTVLLIGRAVQGIGAGGLMPLAMVIFGDTYPLEQRAKIQAFLGPVMFVPQLLGPVVGGFLVDKISWHWVFFINIPVGIISALVMAKGMVESKGHSRPSIDWGGALVLIGALVSLLLTPVLKETQGYAWGSPVLVGLIIVGLALLAVFVWIESKVKEPIIPLHLFRNRNVVVLSALVFTVGLGIIGALSSFPFYAQNVLGLSPTAAGYMTLPMMLGGILASMANGFTLTKLRYRNVFIVSFILPVISFVLLMQIGVQTSLMYIIVSFFILGLGIGVLFAGDNLIVQESVNKEDSGVALSTVQVFQSLGATVGFSFFGSMLATSIAGGLRGVQGLPADVSANIANGGIPSGLGADMLLSIRTVFADAFQHMYVIGLVIAIVTFVICWFMKNEILSQKQQEVAAEQASPTASTLS